MQRKNDKKIGNFNLSIGNNDTRQETQTSFCL